MVTLSSELLFLVLWISLLLDRGFLCRNWATVSFYFRSLVSLLRELLASAVFLSAADKLSDPVSWKKEKRVRNLVALTLQVPRVFNIYNQGKGRYDDKLCYHLLCHLRSSKNWVVGVASRSGRTKPITKRVNVHYDWFILSLLLPSPTIWFSLDRKRRSHKRSLKKMETFWFFRLRFRRAYDYAYDSDFWFSL